MAAVTDTATKESTKQRNLTVYQLLRCTSAEYVQRYGQQAAPQVQSTLAKLSLCRTSALGGHTYRCVDCTQEVNVYNSCGDRHCPQCAGAKRSDWIESTRQLLLDGVNYFQVVFTLPSQLSSLALGNRGEIYDLLFTSAWSATKKTIINEQGYDPAAIATLHTWNQQLEAHAHVHMVVPGGGPAIDGSGWRDSRRGTLEPRTASELYLVDAIALRQAYREQFLKGLSKLRERGELKLNGDFQHLQDEEAWQAFLAELGSKEWGINIQPPPAGTDAEHVFKYLARYLTGGPISDHRIIEADEEHVTFWAREGKARGGDGTMVRKTLTTLEFVRRWCLHILPRGYTKTRSYGGFHNRRRDGYLERCAIQLEDTDAPLTETAFQFPLADVVESDVEQEDKQCPGCGGQLCLVARKEKPSWYDVMNSENRPHWYARHHQPQRKLAKQRANRIESAKGSG